MLCGAHPHQQDNLCAPCRMDIPWSQDVCEVCAIHIGSSGITSGIEGHRICLSCLQEPPLYNTTVCAFDYLVPIDGLINQFKHQRNLAAGRLLTACLSQTIAAAIAQGKTNPPQLLIPVPLHRRRLRQRGFNQAQFIAAGLNQALNFKINTNLCHRPRYHSPQQGLTREKRLKHMEDAFAVTPKAVDQSINSIAIIDDVMTTGATAQALSKSLINTWSGPLNIQVWCVARAQPQNIRLDW